MTQTYLTVTEAATTLRLDEDTIYRLCREGKMPGALRIGGTWRIDVNGLQGSNCDPAALTAAQRR